MEEGTITTVENEEEWDIILQTAEEKLVVVDFYAVWCGPCRVVAPVFERLSQEYASSAIFLKVDVERNQAISSRCGVNAMPTFQFYKNGALVQELRGANGSELERLVALHAGAAPAAQGPPAKRFKSFPPDMYAFFEGERNIDPVWNKLVQFNAQLSGQAGHMDAATQARLKVLFNLTLQAQHVGSVPVPDLELLDGLLESWPAGSAFPLLDIARRLVLLPAAADYYARTAAAGGSSGGAIGRVLRLLESGEGGLGNALMSIRFLANCFANTATRRLVVKDSTALRLVKQHRNHENKQVRLAVATFLLNYAKASACDKEGSAEGAEHTLDTLTACLAAEQEDDTKLRLALGVGSLLSAEPGLLPAAKRQLAFFGLPASPSTSTPLGVALAELAQLLA